MSVDLSPSTWVPAPATPAGNGSQFVARPALAASSFALRISGVTTVHPDTLPRRPKAPAWYESGAWCV